jgi:hypothetical protein
MVREALAAIPRPLRIDTLHVINGNLRCPLLQNAHAHPTIGQNLASN